MGDEIMAAIDDPTEVEATQATQEEDQQHSSQTNKNDFVK
jgi:hypothetical protein